MSHIWDQLCKKFLLNILKTIAWRHFPHTFSRSHIILLIPPHNMHLFETGSLYLFITLLSKNPFNRRNQGAYVSFNNFCFIWPYHSSSGVNEMYMFSSFHSFILIDVLCNDAIVNNRFLSFFSLHCSLL